MIDLEDLLNYADEYEHKYFSTIDDELPKGKINFKDKTIFYNPLYNDEPETFCHELMHHHYIQVYGYDAPEALVEQEALLLADRYKEPINKYLKTNLY